MSGPFINLPPGGWQGDVSQLQQYLPQYCQWLAQQGASEEQVKEAANQIDPQAWASLRFVPPGMAAPVVGKPDVFTQSQVPLAQNGAGSEAPLTWRRGEEPLWAKSQVQSTSVKKMSATTLKPGPVPIKSALKKSATISAPPKNQSGNQWVTSNIGGSSAKIMNPGPTSISPLSLASSIVSSNLPPVVPSPIVDLFGASYNPWQLSVIPPMALQLDGSSCREIFFVHPVQVESFNTDAHLQPSHTGTRISVALWEKVRTPLLPCKEDAAAKAVEAAFPVRVRGKTKLNIVIEGVQLQVENAMVFEGQTPVEALVLGIDVMQAVGIIWDIGAFQISVQAGRVPIRILSNNERLNACNLTKDMQQLIKPEKYSSAYNIQEDNSSHHRSSDARWPINDPVSSSSGGRRDRSPLPSSRRDFSPSSLSSHRDHSPISIAGRRDRSPLPRRDRSLRDHSPLPFVGRRDRSPLPSICRRDRSPLTAGGRKNRSPLTRRDYSPTSSSNNRRDTVSSSRRDWSPLPRETPQYSPPWTSHSPVRKNYTSQSPDRSYNKDSYQSSPRRSPRRESDSKRSKSPLRTESAYRRNRKNMSPPRKNRKSQTPPRKIRSSPSPARKSRRSSSPAQKNRRSPSPARKGRRSQSPTRKSRRSPTPTRTNRRKSPSPQRKKRVSPAPKEKNKIDSTSSVKSSNSRNSGSQDKNDSTNSLPKDKPIKPTDTTKNVQPKLNTQYKSNLRAVPIVSSPDIKKTEPDSKNPSSKQAPNKMDTQIDSSNIRSTPMSGTDEGKPKISQPKPISNLDKSKLKSDSPVNKKTSDIDSQTFQGKPKTVIKQTSLKQRNKVPEKRKQISLPNSPAHKCKKVLVVQPSKTTPTNSKTKSNKVLKQVKLISKPGNSMQRAVVRKRIIRKVIKAMPKKVSSNNTLDHGDPSLTDKHSSLEESSVNALTASIDEAVIDGSDIDLELEDISASEEEFADLEDVSSASDQLDDVSDTELPSYGDDIDKEAAEPTSEVQEIKVEIKVEEEEEIEEQITQEEELTKECNLFGIHQQPEGDHQQEENTGEEQQPGRIKQFEGVEQAEEDQKLDSGTQSEYLAKLIGDEQLAEDDQQVEDDEHSENDGQAEEDQQGEGDHDQLTEYDQMAEDDQQVEDNQQTDEDQGQLAVNDHLTEDDQQAEDDEEAEADQQVENNERGEIYQQDESNKPEEEQNGEEVNQDFDYIQEIDQLHDEQDHIAEGFEGSDVLSTLELEEDDEAGTGLIIYDNNEEQGDDQCEREVGEICDVLQDVNALLLSACESTGSQSETNVEQSGDVTNSGFVFFEGELDFKVERNLEEQSSEVGQTNDCSSVDNLLESVSNAESSALILESSTESVSNAVSSIKEKKRKSAVATTKSPVRKSVVKNQSCMTTRSGRTARKKNL